MNYYSTYQLITNEEILKINELSAYVEEFQKYDRKFSSYKLTNEDKDIFLKKILIWIENHLKIKLNSYNNNLYDTFLINYNTGDFFLKHKDDTFMQVKGSTRKYVCGFHLNNDYIGGEYCLYDSNETHTIIENKIGYPYIFESKMYHEVKPVIEGTRKSIVIHIDKECLETIKKQIL
jgi:predicted 2-oxoglutarate/Fe(II)-dependent dioxygenase YbiX